MAHVNASPLEALALHTLNRLSASDIRTTFETFVEQGLGGFEVASLAIETCSSVLEKQEDIESAFLEILGFKKISQNEALWLAFRYYLKRLVSTTNVEYEAMGPIVELSLEGYPDLFPSSPNSYFADEYGIGMLYGTYYAWDHEIALTGAPSPEHKAEIRKEAKLALERSFSFDCDLPRELRGIQRLAKNERWPLS